jgi:hypothetical protein
MVDPTQSCPELGLEWNHPMPCPKWACTCPPKEKCFACSPELWEWRPPVHRRRGPILDLDEIQVAIARSPSAPSLHTPCLLQDVTTLVAEVGVKGCPMEVVDAWKIVSDRVLLRAKSLGHEWVTRVEPKKFAGPVLGRWVGGVYPDDSVAVVWWTDYFLDHRLPSHAYEDLVGEDCSTWQKVTDELSDG